MKMHFCARGCMCTHMLSLQWVEMFFVTSSAGQEHYLRKKTHFFYHSPLPKYIFLQSAFPVWKVYIFSVKDLDTLWAFMVLLLNFTLFRAVAGGSMEGPATSCSSTTSQLCLCWVPGHPAREDAAGVEATCHLPPGPRCWPDWRRGFVGGKLSHLSQPYVQQPILNTDLISLILVWLQREYRI